jgi:signal transduction histidine kinase
MRDADGRIVKWFGTNTDIDELKRARDTAEKASRAKDDFLAALSHELRTPLTPVLLTVSEMREDNRLSAGRAGAARDDGAKHRPRGAPHRRPPRPDDHIARQAAA